MATVNEVLAQALTLPEKKRVQLVNRLLRSFDAEVAESPPKLSQEWLEEIKRRIEAYERGEVKTYSWDAVKKSITRMLAQKRKKGPKP